MFHSGRSPVHARVNRSIESWTAKRHKKTEEYSGVADEVARRRRNEEFAGAACLLEKKAGERTMAMPTELSKNQWIDILRDGSLTNTTDLSIFQALYAFDGHKAYASQIGILLGYEGKAPHAPLNSEIGRYAKRIAGLYDIEFTERSKRKYKYWDLFFIGWEEGRYFIWQLRPELAEALK